MKLGGALAALILVAASAARGQPAPSDDAGGEPAAAEEHRWADGDHLTGDWGGARSALADRGIQIDAVYASEAFTARSETSLLGHFDLALTLDSGKLGLWDGGTFYVLVQNNHGNSGITDAVGSAQPV